jgi:hypothetical protein
VRLARQFFSRSNTPNAVVCHWAWQLVSPPPEAPTSTGSTGSSTARTLQMMASESSQRRKWKRRAILTHFFLDFRFLPHRLIRLNPPRIATFTFVASPDLVDKHWTGRAWPITKSWELESVWFSLYAIRQSRTTGIYRPMKHILSSMSSIVLPQRRVKPTVQSLLCVLTAAPRLLFASAGRTSQRPWP